MKAFFLITFIEDLKESTKQIVISDDGDSFWSDEDFYDNEVLESQKADTKLKRISKRSTLLSNII